MGCNSCGKSKNKNKNLNIGKYQEFYFLQKRKNRVGLALIFTFFYPLLAMLLLPIIWWVVLKKPIEQTNIDANIQN